MINQEEQLKNLVSSVQSLREEQDSSLSQNIELPGGAGVLGENGVEPVHKGIQITPTPGFTIKTRQQGENEIKVFINICTHEELDKPATKKKLNDDGEEVEGMNVPMSVGPCRACLDNSGITSAVYDIIVNPIVVEDALAEGNGQQRDFLCQLAIQCIENKNKITLDKRYKLPKLQYMGEIANQQVRDKKFIPKIEEMASKQSKSAPKKKKASPVVPVAPVRESKPLLVSSFWLKEKVVLESNGDAPTTTLAWEQAEDFSTVYVDPVFKPIEERLCGMGVSMELVTEPLHSSMGEDNMSDASIMKSIDIKVSNFKLQIKIAGYKNVNLFFPCAVLPQSVQCSLAKKEIGLPAGRRAVHELKVTMTIDKQCHWWESSKQSATRADGDPDPGSRQWLINEALTRDDGISNGGGSIDDAGPSLPPSTSNNNTTTSSTTEFAEDRYHISMPENVDPYTGQALPASGQGAEAMESNEVFAEDKFHQKDAHSTYLINQREQAIKDKHEKHEREKAERGDDPNVEYIDASDFGKGGKWDPKATKISETERMYGSMAPDDTPDISLRVQQAHEKASHVMTQNTSLDGVLGSTDSPDLSSTLWSELL